VSKCNEMPAARWADGIRALLQSCNATNSVGSWRSVGHAEAYRFDGCLQLSLPSFVLLTENLPDDP